MIFLGAFSRFHYSLFCPSLYPVLAKRAQTGRSIGAIVFTNQSRANHKKNKHKHIFPKQKKRTFPKKSSPKPETRKSQNLNPESRILNLVSYDPGFTKVCQPLIVSINLSLNPPLRRKSAVTGNCGLSYIGFAFT